MNDENQNDPFEPATRPNLPEGSVPLDEIEDVQPWDNEPDATEPEAVDGVQDDEVSEDVG